MWCPPDPDCKGEEEREVTCCREQLGGAGQRARLAELSVCLPQAHRSGITLELESHMKEVFALVINKPYTQEAFLPSQRAVVTLLPAQTGILCGLEKMVMQVHGEQ